MTYQIDITDEAQLNIKEASEYYLEISTSLNHKFTADLVKTIDELAENPLYHQIRYKGIRIAHTKTFPFGIHFFIDGTTLRVLKILHHKQYYK
ncbi:hypothetical protein A8C32_09970 [Flavivirga aquatica]|uniref:Plasmid stabilization protein n=1 Tax=Flavivirga aquatica TaxID=1849968 RepID=A0A1E5TER2_9FLAO|nr:type II toxin-antitoxin system RelE/ParE family toxin [Flavivirga aquatica]OEK09828.1 hypothetical protein A8C32_09970 [Flavivirga aquatica]